MWDFEEGLRMIRTEKMDKSAGLGRAVGKKNAGVMERAGNEQCDFMLQKEREEDSGLWE